MIKKLLMVILLMMPFSSYAYECNRGIDQISSLYEIPIHCKTESIHFVKKSITGIQAQDSLIDNFEQYLVKIISPYQKNFLKSHIEEIVLVKDLKYNNVEVGGLSNGKTIYICLDGSRAVQSSYVGTFNHEFSSNIYKYNSYLKRLDWKKYSYEFYDYSREYLLKCLENSNFAKDFSDELRSRGLLINYSKTNDENDFNEYADFLFSKTSTIKKLANSYPKIKEKLISFKEFYKNAGFTGKFPDES